MNLSKLFETQKVLRDRINYNEPDRFNKLILALLVELGECANEWRGFKFWSKDQEPRKAKREKCPKCNGTGMVQIAPDVRGITICPGCDNPRGGIRTTNPLLEEYVDGLHFVLELGLEDKGSCLHSKNYTPYKVMDGEHTKENIEIQFINLFFSIKKFTVYRDLEQTIEMYLGLGEMLGFTCEQIEDAYYSKNSENHRRQDTGY